MSQTISLYKSCTIGHRSESSIRLTSAAIRYVVRFQEPVAFVFRVGFLRSSFFQLRILKSVHDQAAAQFNNPTTPIVPSEVSLEPQHSPTTRGKFNPAKLQVEIDIFSGHGRHCLNYHCGCLPHWIPCGSRLHRMDLILHRPSQTTR